jgi:cytochrome c biogenesis protein CcdA
MPPLTAIFAAAGLGLLFSISPCPLATNIAAMSFIARRLGRTRDVVLSGLLYTLGRSLVYIGIAAAVVAGAVQTPGLSDWLQRHMNQILGPLLILAGMFLLELLSFGTSAAVAGERVQKWAERGRVWAAGLLGILFALSFCPISAGLYFAGLIPLAIKHQSPVGLPLVFGLATAVPVAAFALLVAVGAKSLGAVFNKVAAFERWARRATGLIFIGVGLYYCLRYVFGIY